MARDKYGFLWIATRDGLNRYDGYSVIPFYTPERALGLQEDNYFNALYYNGGDSLFVAVFNTLYVFSLVRYEFSVLPVETGVSARENGDIFDIYPDGRTGLYLCSFESGFLHYEFSSQKTTRISGTGNWNANVSTSHISTVISGKNGIFWIGTFGGGLVRSEPGTGSVNSFKWNPALTGFDYNNTVRSLAWKNQTTLYVGTWGHGLYEFDTRSETFRRIWLDEHPPEKYPYNDIRCLMRDDDGSVWFGTNGGGLYCLGENGSVQDHFTKGSSGFSFIADNDIYAIYKERTGIYWIGTDGAGVQRVNLNLRTIRQDNLTGDRGLKLTNEDIHEVTVDRRGKLWVGSNGRGIMIFSPGNPVPERLEAGSDKNKTLGDNTVYTLAEDQRGRMWIGTNSGGLQLYNPDKKEFQTLRGTAKGTFSLVYTIFPDSRGNVWFSSYSGNFRYNHPGETPSPEDLDTLLNDLPQGTSIQDFFEDPAGNIWMGTNSSGVFRYSSATGKTVPLKDLVTGSPQFIPQNVTGLSGDRKGRIWIAGGGSGLFCFSPETGNLDHFTESDGLMSNNVVGIETDLSGTLWLASPTGITQVVPEETQKGELRIRIFKFGEQDGISNEMLNKFASCMGPDGRLYFGGTSGITSFMPQDIPGQTELLPVIPTRILVNAREFGTVFPELDPNPVYLELLELGPEHQILTIEVASPDLSNGSKLSYQYFLEGFSTAWTTAGTQRSLTFTSLPSGDYVLKVKAGFSPGEMTAGHYQLRIRVNPPLYATWWAIAVYAMVLAGAIVFYVQSKSKRLQREKSLLESQVYARTQELIHTTDELKLTNEALNLQTERLKRLDQKKTELFTNISHEFRTPLTLILSPLEELASKSPQPEVQLMLKNALRMNRLINQLLAIAKADSGEIGFHPKMYPFSEFISGLVSEFAVHAAGQHRSVTELYPESPVFLQFDPDLMEKIVSNLLSNSFKFTRPGDEIRIVVSVKPAENGEVNQVGLLVEDSGIGIPKEIQPFLFDRFFQAESDLRRSYEGSGIGLALVKELVTLHSGRIVLESEPEKGTQIQVWFRQGEPATPEPLPSAWSRSIRREIPDLIDISAGTENPESEPGLPEPRKVLLVEDHPDLQNYLAQIFSRYQVLVAGNGEDGLKKAETFIPDLVISDVMMPVMDGYELVKRLKSGRSTSHIPVLLLTAKSSMESRLTGIDLGADAYLGKPFQNAELLAVAENLIRSRVMLRSYYQEILNPAEVKPEQPPEATEEPFVRKVIDIIQAQMTDPRFDVESLASLVFLSRSQLTRKLTATLGIGPNQLIRTLRLKKAKSILEAGEQNVTETAYSVGITNLAYFSKIYKEEFGHSPNEA